MKPLDDLLIGAILVMTLTVLALLVMAALNEALPPGTRPAVQAYPPDPTLWVSK